MLAYIVRRLLLIIPTLFGIMVINFVVIQAAPGGPVEQLIQQLTKGSAGADVTARVSGTGSGDVARGPDSRASAGEGTGQYRGARGLDPEFIKEIERMYGFDKPMHERFFQMMGQYLRFDFGTSYFRDQTRGRSGAREDAGVDLARPVDHAAHLSDLDPARHPQGGAGRLALRHLDQRRDHRRQRHPELPVRDPADRAVRGRQLLRLVPAARPGLGQLGAAVVAGAHPRLFLAHGPAAARAGHRRRSPA